MTAQKSASVSSINARGSATPQFIRDALAGAVRRVAPLWPLEHFVAVNPFLGFTDESFEAAARRVTRTAGARLLMPRSFYRDACASGRIEDRDIATALARSGANERFSIEDLRRHVAAADVETDPALDTCATVVSRISGLDWEATIRDRVSHWAAGYFDAGQASWPSPFRDLAPYAAWLREARIDCSDTVLGLRGAQEQLASLPETPEALCLHAIERLGVPAAILDLYLHRLLMDVAGWAAHARYRSWRQELGGEAPEGVLDLLAIRLAWELILYREYARDGAELAWRREIGSESRKPPIDAPPSRDEELDLIAQEALECAWQRRCIAALGAGETGDAERPAAQAVFCIDVRSEVLRRAIEHAGGGIETLGFAGFFGLPLEYVPLAREDGPAHCPVLVEAAVAVREAVRGAPAAITERLSARIRRRRQLADGWRAFRNSAVSCFVFVESCGLVYALKLAAHSLGLTRPEPHPAQRGLPPHLARSLGPQLSAVDEAGDGIGLDRQIDFAETMLRSMSLVRGFGRIVMLAGHGATTTNNAHGTALDCGACGGQTGEVNARIAAHILNDRRVREALVEREIVIPADTLFVAALHDTTTDRFTLFDRESFPASHDGDIEDLERQLAEAGARARLERARLLGVGPVSDIDSAIVRRARDWSEVRPEWGLAGCAGFIAAPRRLTRGVDLQGRCFLHSYDYRDDHDFSALEAIMTAPMVVASWISLQYYASTVDNDTFGSGNKTLHNVVGASLGVLEGSGGDLRVGLPRQSVHDGRRPIHEPLRLSVFLAAPITAINAIIEKHEHLRHLVDNGWLRLFAIYDGGDVVVRYAGELHWEPASGQDAA